MQKTKTEYKELPVVFFLLRLGVSLTYLYASINAFINPASWLGWFPDLIRSHFSDTTLLYTWGSGELVIGLWILSGYKIFIPSVLSAGFMLGIFIFDFDTMHVIFRNICILCTSICLAIISNPHYDFKLFHMKN